MLSRWRSPRPLSPHPARSRRKYSGTIDSYDAATKTLTINQKDRKGVFVITDTSEVLQGKTKADPSVFAAGQKVKSSS